MDGLVLARSAFNHSMNYRSVVVFGRATVIDDPAEKFAVLRALSEHMIPGRWDDVRQPTGSEIQQTTVLSLALTEASAKVRSGPPLDDERTIPCRCGLVSFHCEWLPESRLMTFACLRLLNRPSML